MSNTPKMEVEVIKRPAGQIGDDIKKTAWSAVIESFAILILGILFIVWPDTMMKVVSYVVGSILIIKGILDIISYFMDKRQYDFFDNGLLLGVISILIGAAALFIGEDIANVFRIVVGIFIIYESLVRINTAIKLSSIGIESWKYIMLIGVAVLVLGIVVTFSDVASIIGWMMIVAGVVGAIGDILFIQQVDRVAKTIIEKNS
ncbi:DUF308 domain-containing protein [Candidatus Saccharibacteria bacterium]|nr:DUF308 domain-containing protein [Candidatus Saccharibacteria bacterium]